MSAKYASLTGPEKLRLRQIAARRTQEERAMLDPATHNMVREQRIRRAAPQAGPQGKVEDLALVIADSPDSLADKIQALFKAQRKDGSLERMHNASKRRRLTDDLAT